jgi:predicted nuclease of predicted toxin-antitoxin system
LRLLIDEMYPPAIAEQLRRRDHDAVAVTERPELRSLSDPAVFAAAQHEARAVVTENVADFIPLANAADQRGQPHHGLVLVDPMSYPRGARPTIGRMVTALDRLLDEHQGSEPTSLRLWLWL